MPQGEAAASDSCELPINIAPRGALHTSRTRQLGLFSAYVTHRAVADGQLAAYLIDEQQQASAAAAVAVAADF